MRRKMNPFDKAKYILRAEKCKFIEIFSNLKEAKKRIADDKVENRNWVLYKRVD